MATYYSDWFGTQPDLTSPANGYRGPTGMMNGEHKIARATLSTAVADGDVVVFMPVSPKDRLIDLVVTEISSFNAATSITLDLGLYKLTGYCTLGAVLDLDLFASALNIDTTAIARVDETLEAASLVNLDRGKRIWELADITLTLNPAQGRGETWAICGHFNITGAMSVGGEIMVESRIKHEA